ncbi:hypothetical protein GGF46_000134 [Coemansia sp. RSA 552]|nr:hypothetical protein GGF46_000134 [Coemansia sp. RSA 552]
MNQTNRVKDDEEYEYNLDDWYTAPRETKMQQAPPEAPRDNTLQMVEYTDEKSNRPSLVRPGPPGMQQQGARGNWPAPSHEPSYHKPQAHMGQNNPVQPSPLYSQMAPLNPSHAAPGFAAANNMYYNAQQRGNRPQSPFARDVTSQYSSAFGDGSGGRRQDTHSITSSNLYGGVLQSSQGSAHYDRDPQQHGGMGPDRDRKTDSRLVVLTNLPPGAGVEDPRDYAKPMTASSIGSSQAMGSPYSGDTLKQSRQHLLNKNNGGHSAGLSSPASAYSPPGPPLPSSTQYSTGTQLSRDKSIRDTKDRRAGGDSCMGECCSCCCGGCLRCACCPAWCCCMGPIITTILVILILVGAALAIYFNWDKITNAVQGDNNDPPPAAAPAPAPPPDAGAAAARALVYRAAVLARGLARR